MRELITANRLLSRSLKHSRRRLYSVRTLQSRQRLDHCRPNTSSTLLLGSAEIRTAER